MPAPSFLTEKKLGRDLIVCVIGDSRGAARILSAGIDEAKARAQQQAEALWKAANGAA